MKRVSSLKVIFLVILAVLSGGIQGAGFSWAQDVRLVDQASLKSIVGVVKRIKSDHITVENEKTGFEERFFAPGERMPRLNKGDRVRIFFRYDNRELAVSIHKMIPVGRQPNYDAMERSCEGRDSVECCRASVKRMKEGGYFKASQVGGNSMVCPKGYSPNMLKCLDSFRWCEPLDPNIL